MDRTVCRFLLAACWFLLVAITGAMALAAEPPADFPRSDEYYASGRSYTYVAKAREFLRENPKAVCAPRVAFDLFTVAEVERNQTLSTEMGDWLVLEHPESVYARFVLSVLPDVQRYRQVLGRLADAHWETADKGFCEAYCAAARWGLDRWGPQLVSDDSFALNTAVLADVGRDVYLRSLCRTQFQESKNDKTRRVAEAVLDAECGPVEKVLRLHAIEDDATAARIKRFFFSTLSAEQKARPEVVRASIESYLEAGNLGDALPLVQEQLAGRDDPQLRFWLAWCLAAQGSKKPALDAVAEMEKRYPNDPWTAIARQLARESQAIDEHLAAYAEGMVAAIQRLRRSDTDAFEGRFVYRCEDGREIRAYLAMVTSQGAFELVLGQRDRTVLAYQARDRQGKVYFDGEPVIHAFRGKAKYPLLAGGLLPDGKGGMNFNWNFNFQDSPEALAQSKDRIGLPPQLLTPEGMAAFLRQTLLPRGWVPSSVETGPDGARYAWLRPLVRHPEFDRADYRIAADGTLASFQFKSLAATSLRYGPSRNLRLSPPKWPNRPVVTRDEMDPAALFRGFAAVMSLRTPQEKASASKGAPERR